jgi:hypothetical protein
VLSSLHNVRLEVDWGVFINSKHSDHALSDFFGCISIFVSGLFSYTVLQYLHKIPLRCCDIISATTIVRTTLVHIRFIDSQTKQKNLNCIGNGFTQCGDFIPSVHTAVCSSHFLENGFESRNKLKL